MGGTAFFSSTRSSILDWDFPLQISQLVRVPPWLWTLQYQKKSHSRINKILFTCILDSMGYSLSDSILEIMRMFDGSPGFSHPFSPFFFVFFWFFHPVFSTTIIFTMNFTIFHERVARNVRDGGLSKSVATSPCCAEVSGLAEVTCRGKSMDAADFDFFPGWWARATPSWKIWVRQLRDD